MHIQPRYDALTRASRSIARQHHESGLVKRNMDKSRWAFVVCCFLFPALPSPTSLANDFLTQAVFGALATVLVACVVLVYVRRSRAASKPHTSDKSKQSFFGRIFSSWRSSGGQYQ